MKRATARAHRTTEWYEDREMERWSGKRRLETPEPTRTGLSSSAVNTIPLYERKAEQYNRVDVPKERPVPDEGEPVERGTSRRRLRPLD